jgi:hypothetical protein
MGSPMEARAVLTDVRNCPHCGVANPQMAAQWKSQQPIKGRDPGWQSYVWACYNCTTCGGVVLTRVLPDSPIVARIYPATRTAHSDIPEPAKTFLQQAFETLHAPDAAAVMGGSAVDAMLKALGYTEGSLYSRIDKAVVDHKLTAAMGDWAHEVRLGSNRPRHADKENPHVNPAEAKQSVEFAEALANFLFVLSAKIERGKEDAKKASQPTA